MKGLLFLFPLFSVFLSLDARAQELKFFRGYEGKIESRGDSSLSPVSTVFSLRVDEEVDTDEKLGRRLHLTLSEETGRERIGCERTLSLDSRPVLSTCGGKELLFERPSDLLSERITRAGLMDAEGHPMGWVSFELRWLQHGVHEGARDD